MRRSLLALLGDGSSIQSSYLPGRSGLLLTTSRSLAELRLAFAHSGHACRLYPVHRESGRLFLEPSPSWLCRALRRDAIAAWWSEQHQQGAAQFFSPRRADRVRRLPVAAASERRQWARGYRSLRSLALRLEALHATPKPAKHWTGIGKEFDALWAGTRLYTAPPDPLSQAVFAQLRRLGIAASAAGLLQTSPGYG